MKNQKHYFASACAGLAVLALAACGSAATPTAAPPTAAPPTVAPPTVALPTATTAAEAKPQAQEEEVARPSNPGGPGEAVNLKGDAAAGAKIYVDNCKKCHGDEGKGGVNNPGSTDGTIPALNPIDETLIDKDAKVTATNIDLFLEHGSTPAGNNPKEKMAGFGDDKKLTPQQIADVIAYVVSLNPK